MKIACGFFPPLVVPLLVFTLSSQPGIASAAGDESQDRPAPAEKTPTVPVVEEGATPPSPAAGETPRPPAEPAPAPARQGPTPTSEAAEKPSDADTPEHGHLGLVLGMAKGIGLGGPRFAYGLRGGLRIWHIEIGFLASSSGKFDQYSGDLAVYPILFRLNGIVDLDSFLSLFVGGQLGLVHYHRYFSMVDGAAGASVFAGGLQAGGALRLTSHLSLRFELAWLRAGSHSVEAQHRYPSGEIEFQGDIIDGRNFLNLYGALCLTL